MNKVGVHVTARANGDVACDPRIRKSAQHGLSRGPEHPRGGGRGRPLPSGCPGPGPGAAGPRRPPPAPDSAAPRGREPTPPAHTPRGCVLARGGGGRGKGVENKQKKITPKEKKNKRERGQKYFQMFGGCRSQSLPQHMIHGGPSGWCLHLIPC